MLAVASRFGSRFLRRLAGRVDPVETETFGQATVVRLHVSALVEEVIEPVARRLFQIVQEQPEATVILNLELVEDLTSDMLGYLLALQRLLKSRGGAFRLCQLNPQLAVLFRRLMLHRLFTICADERAALAYDRGCARATS
jgi:anti-anti-sigma regulatory factor